MNKKYILHRRSYHVQNYREQGLNLIVTKKRHKINSNFEDG